jgi:hypothetical protein
LRLETCKRVVSGADCDDALFLEAVIANGESTSIFLAAYNAVRQWKFTPYVHDGKPVPF